MHLMMPLSVSINPRSKSGIWQRIDHRRSGFAVAPARPHASAFSALDQLSADQADARRVVLVLDGLLQEVVILGHQHIVERPERHRHGLAEA